VAAGAEGAGDESAHASAGDIVNFEGDGGGGGAVLHTVHPVYDSVKEDPRYIEIPRKTGLPD
jgi:hypothetical protein